VAFEVLGTMIVFGVMIGLVVLVEWLLSRLA